MKCVILAAGKGRRLQPLTSELPKCMIPIHGKPLLEHLISSVKKSGIEEICLVVGYRRQAIIEYFGDGKKLGVDIAYRVQDELLGTADALYRAKEYLKDENAFLVAFGDTFFTPGSLSKLIKKYEETKADAVVVIAKAENPERYGVVTFNKKRNPKRFIEKPRVSPSAYVVTGAAIFTKPIFEYVERIGPGVTGELLLTDVLTMMVEHNLVVITVAIDSIDWGHIDNMSDFLKMYDLVC